MLYFSQLTEDNGNPSVACQPAYQVAATGEVDLAVGMFTHTADKANRGNIANMGNILEGEREDYDGRGNSRRLLIYL